MSSYKELVAQRGALEKQQAELDKQIAQAKRAERADVIAQIRALMAEHELGLVDLGGTGKGRAGKVSSGKAGTGKKVAAKYRNSTTGDTWSGRGLQPKWLKAALASGRSLKDFAL